MRGVRVFFASALFVVALQNRLELAMALCLIAIAIEGVVWWFLEEP